MNILIYGATEFGYMTARRLYQEHNVVLIDALDRLPEKFNSLDIGFISGGGADVAALEQADVDSLDLFIACSRVDEANIVACWTIKKIGSTETICFVYSRALYQNLTAPTPYRTRYDIDRVIWPQELLCQDIFRIIMVPDAIDVEYFADGRAKLFEYRIKENSPLINIRIRDCGFPRDVLIVGITRDHELFIPDGETTILYDDKVIFMGKSQALDILAAEIFQQGNPIRTAAVIGGGIVGCLLAERLELAGVRVKIIESDEERCAVLVEQLKQALVLHGDGTDLELLESELAGQADVVVSVTNNDEKNLLCSLLVKQLGCDRIITRVENARNMQLFERVGVDVVVSPRESALTELLNRVQARNVDILALVEGGQGEVLRLTLPEGFPETRVMDLGLKARAVIVMVQRGHEIIIPRGETLLRPGDMLKVFAMAEDAETVKEHFAT